MHHARRLVLAALSTAALAACGDDTTGAAGAGGGASSATGSSGGTTSGSTSGTTSATTTSGAGGGGGSSSVSQGSGGETSSSAGGAGPGSGGGGAGGAEGFPWEGALDPNGSPSSDRLTPRPASATDAPQGFYEYLPPGYPGPEGTRWPLLVFTHGIGENGDGEGELGRVLATGIPDLIERDLWAVDRPYVVLMPQHPGGGCPGAQEIFDMIAWGTESYEIDPRYVYLTGLSCGAIGAWSYLGAHLDAQIAAMVPIAGNGIGAWEAQGCELGRVAIWAFHGDADGVVDVSGTNVPMDGLAGCPSPPARENIKTIYPGVGHDSWSSTYDLSAGHDIYTWMLGFTKDP